MGWGIAPRRFAPLLCTITMALLFGVVAPPGHTARLKEIATVAGVRDNQLVGYGLVIGLDGTGDQTTQTPFTVQSTLNMLRNLGVTLPPGTRLQLKNVAAVMVTAELPPFAQPGQRLDVTVSSIGNAKSLRGGTLVMTPLKGADGQVYAIAQGNILVGGTGAQAGGASQTINHLAAGRIPGGATVERAVDVGFEDNGPLVLELKGTDFATATKVVEAINQRFGPGRARARDGRTIEVDAPATANERVAFLGRLEELEVTPAPERAKVVVNSRTGSVVLNQAVRLAPVAVAHGNLKVTVGEDLAVSQPTAPLAGGQTVAARQGKVAIEQPQAMLHHIKRGADLAEVIRALNALGATPMDLISILQAMKAAGALEADLEVI